MRSFFALAIAALSLIGLGVVSLEEVPPAGVAAELPVTSAVVSHDVRPAGDAPAPHAPPARAERDASEILRQARADAEAPLIEPIDPSIPVPWQLADGPHVAVPVGNEHVPATAAELDPQVLARA
ncbi:MAG: hypothetical protein HKP30_08785, partial [Myxococcales bacterium]|nr:hypothetical protein [Myxococcales bacterium]